MSPALYKYLPYGSILFLMLLTSGAKENCSTPQGTCNSSPCDRSYCLGPASVQLANAPVFPKTCNGDFVITLGGVYWKAAQEGLNPSIENAVIGSDGLSGNAELTNLVDSHFLNPQFKWDFGLQIGAAYHTPCDGWDIDLLWTYFHQGSSGQASAPFDSNTTLLPILSAFQFPSAGLAPILFATKADRLWKFDLNLVDLSLGRAFWTSKRLSIRPYLGLRIGSINQRFNITYQGGSWNNLQQNRNLLGKVKFKNDFEGIGIRGGFDSYFHGVCGFGLYGRIATSIVYGRFDIDHKERLSSAKAPFDKTTIFHASNGFRASRAMIDLDVGIAWEQLFCDCTYGVSIQLGWGQHLFFNQNQLWQVTRLGQGVNFGDPINSSGENTFSQRKGSLSVGGWALSGSLLF